MCVIQIAIYYAGLSIQISEWVGMSGVKLCNFLLGKMMMPNSFNHIIMT